MDESTGYLGLADEVASADPSRSGPEWGAGPGNGVSLAAATAAIITARWHTSTAHAWVPPSPTGYIEPGEYAGNGHDRDRHTGNGHGGNGRTGNVYTSGSYPAVPPVRPSDPRIDTMPQPPPGYWSDEPPSRPAYEPPSYPADGSPGYPPPERPSYPSYEPPGYPPPEPSSYPSYEPPGYPPPEPSSYPSYEPPAEPTGTPAPSTVPGQRAASVAESFTTQDDFHSPILSDLPFPAPFEPEPYEPYDPWPRAAGDGPELAWRPGDGPELPQRVPSVPDLPEALLPTGDPGAEPAELSRIATFLRDDDRAGPPAGPRPDGFDLASVLEAVRSVADVSDAQLRWNSGSGHTLRIEFRDGVDEAEVTRQVARLLRETMGLTAQPSASWLGHLEPPRLSTTRTVPAPRASRDPDPTGGARPLPPPRRSDGTLADVARVVLDHVQVTTLGVDATVEVRLSVSRRGARLAASVGRGRGPAVDAYLLRLAGVAAGDAVDQLLADPSGRSEPRGRCFPEHVAVVPFAGVDVAVVVLLLVSGSAPEQLCGSAVVTGDPVQAVVRATLSALNRRLESLLS